MLRMLRTAEEALVGIEGEVDGAAFDEGLFSPRAQELVGGEEIKALLLFAERDGALQQREDDGFSGDEDRDRHAG